MSEGAVGTGGDAGNSAGAQPSGAEGAATGGESTQQQGQGQSQQQSVAGALSSPTAGQTEPAPEVPSWMQGLSTDDMAYVENKGWHKAEKPIEAILKSYRNTERLRGVPAEKLAKIPNWENEEEVAAFRAQLGVPEAPDGYEIPETEIPTGQLDPSVLAGISHKLGHTPQQAKEHATAIAEHLTELYQQQEQARTAQNKADEESLKKEWGPEYEANDLAALKAAERFDLEAEDIDAMRHALGHKKTKALFARIGRSLGEHKRGDEGADPKSQPFGLTAEVAQKRIADLRKDTGFYAKLKAGDATAKQEWENLHQVAYFSR